jgi:hypothetical protein
MDDWDHATAASSRGGGLSMTIAVGELKMEASRSGWGCLGDWGQEEDNRRTEWCWLGGENRVVGDSPRGPL